ncbi:MAG: MBOAT family O-acyltransferase [Flavobacteriales bacterium]
MIFNSLEFAVFLAIAFVLYWFVFNKKNKSQNILILVLSYIFYGWWDWRFLSLIAFSSLVDYLVGVQLEKNERKKNRKILLAISLTANLGLLGVFKYFNFFSNSLAEAFSNIGIQLDVLTLSVVLPVGISFYTFQTLSYSIDTYRGNIKPAKNIIDFFAYVSFFPQLVAGPIERATNLLPQFQKPRSFSYENGSMGMRLILWGLFKKIVIADNCAIYVDDIFIHYKALSSLELIWGSVLFAFQIYGDFSGYSDIAIGTAKLFGFELMTNFKTPYFSRDIAEFWRKWHISLSTWFRDYLYIPLGGSQVSVVKKIRNTFIIFLVSGFWHGANWTFLVWGLLNAIYFIPLLLTNRNRKNLDSPAENKIFPSFLEFFSIASTFMLTCIAWIFFRSSSLTEAITYLEAIFTKLSLPRNLDLFKKYMIVILLFWLVLEWLGRKDGVHKFISNIKSSRARYAIYLLIIFILLIYGSFEETEFIYFQF